MHIGCPAWCHMSVATALEGTEASWSSSFESVDIEKIRIKVNNSSLSLAERRDVSGIH